MCGHRRNALHTYSDCIHASNLSFRECGPRPSNKHFLTSQKAPQLPARSLCPKLFLMHPTLVYNFIRPIPPFRFPKNNPASLSPILYLMMHQFVYGFIHQLEVKNKGHQASKPRSLEVPRRDSRSDNNSLWTVTSSYLHGTTRNVKQCVFFHCWPIRN